MSSESDARPLTDLHPFDPAILESPFAFYRRLHAEAPVHRDPHTKLVLVASHARVLEVLRQPEIFSNHFGRALMGRTQTPPEVAEIQAQGFPAVDTLLTADAPEHKRFRGLVNKAFTPRRVGVLEPGVRKIAEDLVDRFVGAGHCELISQFAVELPLTVIADQLGVPRRDLDRFKRWTDGFTTQLSGLASPESAKHAAREIVAFQHYFADRLEEAREAPRDDIISDLVRARLEGERPLDVPESLSILQQLLVAGHETTAAAIAEGVLLLLQNPDQLERVRSDPGLVPNLVEEVLRLAAPTQNMWRLVKRDCELSGVAIREGELVLISFGAANRDPAQFPDPEHFDVGRENAAEHVSFGHGTHFCIAAMLARKEMEVAFQTLLSRLRSVRLEPGFQPSHKPSVLLRGLRELPLEFEAA
jgi:cytochrome P450